MSPRSSPQGSTRWMSSLRRRPVEDSLCQSDARGRCNRVNVGPPPNTDGTPVSLETLPRQGLGVVQLERILFLPADMRGGLKQAGSTRARGLHLRARLCTKCTSSVCVVYRMPRRQAGTLQATTEAGSVWDGMPQATLTGPAPSVRRSLAGHGSFRAPARLWPRGYTSIVTRGIRMQ
jgi:hypothetical protein